MTISLTFNDQPLLFDAGNQAKSFMDRFQQIDDLLPYIADSIFRQDGKEGPVGQSHVGLASPNYPQPPRPRLNELYWPTGAARWARGFFLVSKTVKDELAKVANFTGELVYKDTSSNFEYKFHMSRLAAIPVSCTAGETLWIQPLVDDRYFWQFINLGDLEQSLPTTWKALFDYLSQCIHPSGLPDNYIGSDGIDAAYGRPDPDECARRFRNVPQLLDAAAHSVGRRLVYQPISTTDRTKNGWSLMSWTDTDKTYKLNLTKTAMLSETAQDWFQIAGDEYTKAVNIPQHVEVVFPKYIHRMKQRWGRVYRIKVDSAGTIVSHTSGVSPSPVPAPGDSTDVDQALTERSKVFHTTYWAQYDTEELTDCADPSPINDAGCQALAIQIANDYFRSVTIGYDYTYVGIKDWMFTGYDDHATYYLGGEEEIRSLATTDVTPTPDHMTGNFPKIIGMHDRRFMTRVQSSPMNFGIEDMLHQDPDTDKDVIFRPLGLDRIIAKTNTNGIPGANGIQLSKANCEVYYIDDNDELKVYVDDNGDPETHEVHNLDAAAIPGDTFIKIGKELLSGKKIFSGGGGSSVDCNTVRFIVQAYTASIRTAIGLVLSKPYGCGTIPDSFLGGRYIEICDPQGCHFNRPLEEIMDSHGWARYQLPLEANFCQPDPNYLVPQWEVVNLCCHVPTCET